MFGHLSDERHQAAIVPISVSNTVFAVLCCRGRFGNRKPMMSFFQINTSNTINTLSTVHFRRAMGRRKLFGKVGGKNEIVFRFTTVVMLVYGCFSCVHSILVCWPSVRLDDQFLLLIYISAPVPATVPGFDGKLLPHPSLPCLV